MGVKSSLELLSIIQNQEVFNIQSKRITFFEIWRSDFSDGLKYISRKKTSAIRYYKTYNHNLDLGGEL